MVADPYKALGLGHDASKDDIKKAYRSLAMKLHPDRLTRNQASEEEMHEATTKPAITGCGASKNIVSPREQAPKKAI